MNYSLMTTFYLSLPAWLIFVNAGCLSSKAYESSAPTKPDQMVRVGLPPSIDPADALPPGWQKSLDEKARAQLNEMSAAVQKYAADHNLNPPRPASLTLDDLVKAKYIKEIPPGPAGKKFIFSRTYMIVVPIDNK
jgi:hypothetical protein